MQSYYHTAIIENPGKVRFRRQRRKPPGPTQIQVRLEGCGVCGSNLPVWQGRPWFTYPLENGAPGHEGWGIVENIGPDVADFKPGQRVALLTCHAFSEIETTDCQHAVLMPSSLKEIDFPGEALGCAMNVWHRADIQAGQTVAIIGLGFLGCLLTALAAAAGATVIGISRREEAQQAAANMGATHLIPMLEHQSVINEIKRLTGGMLCQRVIEATGFQWPLDLAGEICAERGRLIIAGYHQDGPRQVNMQLWNWRGLDVINAHERDPKTYRNGIRDAMDMIANGTLNPSPLYTHRFPLHQLSSALDLLETRKDGFMKALVTYA